MTYEQKLKTLVMVPDSSSSQAYRLGDLSAPQVSGFEEPRTITNPINAIIEKHKSDTQLSGPITDLWNELRKHTLPSYLSTVYTLYDINREVMKPIKKEFTSKLKSVSATNDDKSKMEFAFHEQQFRTIVETCTSVFGADDQHRQDARKRWDALKDLLERANASMSQDFEKIHLPYLTGAVAASSLILERPMTAAQSTAILDDCGQALADMRRQIKNCKKDGRTAELDQRNHVLGEMMALIDNAYSVNDTLGGRRFLVKPEWKSPLGRMCHEIRSSMSEHFHF
ncbi:hypothetical protein I302_104798 [Kwoniella bestiolae CBS 10118]|uniref:Uncharacterized protein n=1 Tax=Kwoniella bestiolae CBS 10118 TaxID=1296100 RepID=A0A1B9FRQ8_9TREE|nr:hypothetical protein I302_09133 [Kwoniella bestiolae CBS 10118]OCF21454.1 hypothetical protein I302_09133 [Kwoniella bestiolae CBS 10118]